MRNFRVMIHPKDGVPLSHLKEQVIKLSFDTTGFTISELNNLTKGESYIIELRDTRWSERKVRTYLEKLLGTNLALHIEPME